MKQFMAVVLMIGFVVAADDPKRDKTKDDKEKLQGTWIMSAGEQKGEKAPAEALKAWKIVIKGDTIIAQHGEKEDKATFKLDPSKKPKAIDITSSKPGKEPSPGIYELDGDDLKLCFSKGGDERPMEFATKRSSPFVLWILKREKK